MFKSKKITSIILSAALVLGSLAIAAPSPSKAAAAGTYEKITSVSDIQDGDKILMVFNGETPANIDSPGKTVMTKTVKNGDDGNGSIRVGFSMVPFSGNTDDTIDGSAYEAHLWTFTKSGSNWKIGSDGKFMKFTTVSNQGIHLTLEADGNEQFEITGTAAGFNFKSGSTVINYNKRGVFNGYASTPAGFVLYKFVEGGTPKPSAAPTVKPTTAPTSKPGVSKKYMKITRANQILDGDKVLMIFNGTTVNTSPGKVFMIPSVVTKTDSSDNSTRVGFDIVNFTGTVTDTITSAAYNDYEWTFKKVGNNWNLGKDGKYIKYTETSDMKTKGTLETTGETLTMGGTVDAFTFVKDGVYLNYNKRLLINPYASESDAAGFILYRVDDGRAVPTAEPTATPKPTKTPKPSATPKATDTPSGEPIVLPTDAPLPTVAPTAAPDVAPTVAPSTDAAKASIKIVGKKVVKAGKTIKLKAKLTNLKGKVKWSVNKKKLATISKAGKLKAKKKGTVKVTAKVGKIKKIFKIKIK